MNSGPASLAELLSKLPEDDFAARLAALEKVAQADPKAFAELMYDWSFWGRPAQQEPTVCLDPDCRCLGKWTTWVILAGRGWGKTRTGSETVVNWARRYPGCRIALVARAASDARGVMIEGESGILARSPKWFAADYEPSKLKITWPNGSMAVIFTAEEPDGPRGYQHHFYWADEIAAWKHAQDCWDNLMMGHRLITKSGWPSDFRLRGLVTTTPRAIPIIWSFVREKDIDPPRRPSSVHITKGATHDNRANLGETFFSQIVSQYEGSRLGEQELYGAILEDVPGAMWKSSYIEPYRVDLEALPDQYTSVVAVDPATTSAGESNNTGIIVVAAGPPPGQAWGDDWAKKLADETAPPVDTVSQYFKRLDRLHAYVLQDGTIKGSPEKWAQRAIELYHEWDCRAIVAEANQGGDMVKHTLHSVDPTVPIRLVHAAKRKETRAEPIVALYEQGRVHHVRPREMLKLLEKEQLEWDPELSKSPDRLDALVWGVWYLLIKKRVKFAFNPHTVGERERNPWSTSELEAS